MAVIRKEIEEEDEDVDVDVDVDVDLDLDEDEDEDEDEEEGNYIYSEARDWLRQVAELESLQKNLAGLERTLRVAEATAELLCFTARSLAGPHGLSPSPEIFEWSFAALEALKFLWTNDGYDYDYYCYERRRLRGRGSEPVSEFFLCPISRKMMKEPVVIASGKTFERSVIEKWLDEGNRTCPLTKQVLPNTILIRNLQIAQLISSWRSLYKRKREIVRDREVPIELHERIRSKFYSLVYIVTSNSGSKRVEATKAFRDLIILHKRAVNYLLGKIPQFIILLVHLLFESHCKADAELQNEILGIICVAAEHLPNKWIITEVQEAIPILIVALREGLSMEIKTKCAIIFSLLSDDIPANKVKIGELGGMGLLVGLLKAGDSEAKRVAAFAISKLCEARENWGRAFMERAAIAALRAIYCNEPVEQALSILWALTGCHLILSEMMTEIVSLHESIDAEGIRNLEKEVIEVMESGAAQEINESEVSCSPEIAEVLRWLKRRSDFPRTVGYETKLHLILET